MTAHYMHATILLSHGSRDPAWRIPMENVALCMLRIDPQAVVRCAFLELTEPDLASAAAELIALNVISITIVPMFLGLGKHAREDIPTLIEGLRTRYPGVNFKHNPSVGEVPQVIEVLAKIAMSSP